MFLGIRADSGEVWVGDAEGIWETRTVHRRPVEERWDVQQPNILMQVGQRSCRHIHLFFPRLNSTSPKKTNGINERQQTRAVNLP